MTFRLFGHKNYTPLSPCRRSQDDQRCQEHIQRHGALCNHELPVTDIFFILPKVQSFLIIRRSLKLQEIHHHIVLRLVQIHLQNFNIETCLEHISRPPLPVQNRVEYSARTLCSTDSVFESITATYGTLIQQKSDYIEADRSSIAQM